MSQPRRGQRKPSIDEGLDALLSEARFGVPFSQTQIATRCQCAPETITVLEQRALRSLRRLLSPILRELMP